MTSTSTSTISPRQTSLLNLNNWIDELELAITEDATPTVLTLTKQIERAGHEHYELFYAGGTTDEDFNAMVRRFTAAGAAFKAARAAVIAAKEAQHQVTAGVDEADQVTAGATTAPAPLPNSSSVSAGDAAVAYEEAPPPGGAVSAGGAIPSTVDAGGRAGLITAGVIAEIQSNQAALAASIAELQSNQVSIASALAELQSNQVSIASTLASIQQEQRGLASSVGNILATVKVVQSDARALADDLAAVRTQAYETLPRQHEGFAVDMLRQVSLLRRDFDRVQHQRLNPAPPTDLLIDFSDLLNPPIKPPCQRTISSFSAFPDPPAPSAVPAPPTTVPVLVRVPSDSSDSPPSGSGPVSSETPRPSSPLPPTPPQPPLPSAASPASVAHPPTPGGDSSDDDALHCGSDAIVQPPFPSPACPSRPIDDG